MCDQKPANRTVHGYRFIMLSRIVPLMLLVMLGGCIQTHTTVHVRKDGSGTIEQKTLFSGMLGGIMKNPVDSLSATGDGPLPKGERLDEMAAEFGPEVRVKEVKPIDNKDGSGFLVTYTYPDIGKVRIGNTLQQSNALKADSSSVSSDSEARTKPETWYTFTMKRDPHPVLTIDKQSELFASSRKTTESSSAMSDNDRKQMLDLMSAFMKGAKVVIEVVVDGNIIKSDATYRVGNRITLYSADFDRLLNRRDLFSPKFANVSDREMIRKLGPTGGLKLEAKNRVSVVIR